MFLKEYHQILFVEDSRDQLFSFLKFLSLDRDLF